MLFWEQIIFRITLRGTRKNLVLEIGAISIQKKKKETGNESQDNTYSNWKQQSQSPMIAWAKTIIYHGANLVLTPTVYRWPRSYCSIHWSFPCHDIIVHYTHTHTHILCYFFNYKLEPNKKKTKFHLHCSLESTQLTVFKNNV